MIMLFLDVIHCCLLNEFCRFLKQCLANKAVTMSDYTIALLCNACMQFLTVLSSVHKIITFLFSDGTDGILCLFYFLSKP